MSDDRSGQLPERVLMLLSTSRDGEIACGLLEKADMAAHPCAGPKELQHELGRGVGAVILAEEALVDGSVQAVLGRFVEQQPAWSDLPVLLLARAGANSLQVGDAIATLGNVTLLERPLRVAALVSTVRMMLRARRRQYEIRQQLKALERARDAEATAAQRKDEFLAMLAHELRNPLAPVRNALHLLDLDDSDPARREELRVMIRRQVEHMVRLVDDLLEASRVSRGMIALQRDRMDLGAALRSAVDAVRPLADAQGFHIEVDVPAIGLPMSGDPVRLAQVFGNLLNNALRYGRPSGTIRVRLTHRDGRDALVEFEDDGVGIDGTLLPHVFELFTQGQRTTRGMQEGMGIGLSLVRTLVELHGGEATAHSDGLGQGACIKVRLPLLAGDQADAPAKAVQTPLRDATGLRVLVADDNVDAATSLGMVLQSMGAECCIVHDGPGALDAAVTFVPDVLLLDIGMPGMDGYEVARRLRGDPRFRDLLVVAVSGWSDVKDIRNTHEAGFDHHLAKPVDIQALARLLGGRRPVESRMH